jgi:hypothetical protein
MANDAHTAYPPLPKPARAKPLLGVAPNAASQNPTGTVYAQDGYTLAIVEFDDQGVCYDRKQMQAMADALPALSGRAPIIIVFTHGWRHDGRSDDENLTNFCLALQQTAIDAPDRPVLGVYAAWRGLSWCTGAIEIPTLWGRQDAARRVALGSIRDVWAAAPVPRGRTRRRQRSAADHHRP